MELDGVEGGIAYTRQRRRRMSYDARAVRKEGQRNYEYAGKCDAPGQPARGLTSEWPARWGAGAACGGPGRGPGGCAGGRRAPVTLSFLWRPRPWTVRPVLGGVRQEDKHHDPGGQVGGLRPAKADHDVRQRQRSRPLRHRVPVPPTDVRQWLRPAAGPVPYAEKITLEKEHAVVGIERWRQKTYGVPYWVEPWRLLQPVALPAEGCCRPLGALAEPGRLDAGGDGGGGASSAIRPTTSGGWTGARRAPITWAADLDGGRLACCTTTADRVDAGTAGGHPGL